MEDLLSQNAGGTYVGQGMHEDSELSDRDVKTVNYCLKVAFIMFLVSLSGFLVAATIVILIEYKKPYAEYRRI